MASATGGKVLTLKSCLQALTWHFLAQDVASSPCGASAGHPLSRNPHRILCPRHGSVPVPEHTGSYGQCDTSTRCVHQPCRPLTRVPGFIPTQHPRQEPKAGLNPGHQPCCQGASPCHLALRAPALLAPRGSSQFPTSSLGPAFTPWPRSLWWCRAFILVSRSLLGGSWWPV